MSRQSHYIPEDLPEEQRTLMVSDRLKILGGPEAHANCTSKQAELIIAPLLRYDGSLIVDLAGEELHQAMVYKNAKVFIMLLERGANPNALNHSDVPNLYTALNTGLPDYAVALIHYGAKVDEASMPEGHPLCLMPIHLAAEKGYSDVITALVNRRATPDALDKQGRSAFYYARKAAGITYEAAVGSPAIFALLAAGGYANRTDIATLRNEGVIENSEYEHLQNHEKVGSRINSRDKTPIRILTAMLYQNFDTFNRHLEIIEQNQGVNTPLNHAGDALIHFAVRAHSHHALHALLRKNADISTDNGCKNTPLHEAVLYDNAYASLMLLAHGANPFTQNRRGETPDKMRWQEEAASPLLQLVNPKIWEAINGHREHHNQSKNLGSAFFSAVALGVATVIEQTLRVAPHFIGLADMQGYTALHHTTLDYSGKTTEIALQQLEKLRIRVPSLPVSPNAPAAHAGLHLVHLAAVRGNVMALTALASHKVDIAAPDEHGLTAAHYAAANGDIRTLKCLLTTAPELARAAGTSVNHSWRWTPLHFAAQNGHAEAVALLLNRGADALAKTNAGATALTWANHGLKQYEQQNRPAKEASPLSAPPAASVPRVPTPLPATPRTSTIRPPEGATQRVVRAPSTFSLGPYKPPAPNFAQTVELLQREQSLQRIGAGVRTTLSAMVDALETDSLRIPGPAAHVTLVIKSRPTPPLPGLYTEALTKRGLSSFSDKEEQKQQSANGQMRS